jgi:hypothetical protein
MTKEYYAYIDKIKETGEVIYCGKGDQYRSNIDLSPKRNRYYNIIAKNYKLVRERFLVQDEETAFLLEAYLSDIFHTWIDDPFATKHACNIKQCGSGGICHSQESNNKVSESLKNYYKNNPMPQNVRDKCIAAARAYVPTPEDLVRNGLVHRIKTNQLNDQTGEIINTFPSAKEASRQTGICYTNISECCRKLRTRAGGYKWEYML